MSPHVGLCVGGPLNGQWIANDGDRFRVAKPPDNGELYPTSDETELLQFIEGVYLVHDVPTAERYPQQVWAWKGWNR